MNSPPTQTSFTFGQLVYLRPKLVSLSGKLVRLRPKLVSLSGELVHLRPKLVSLSGELVHLRPKPVYLLGELVHLRPSLVPLSGKLVHLQARLIFPDPIDTANLRNTTHSISCPVCRKLILCKAKNWFSIACENSITGISFCHFKYCESRRLQTKPHADSGACHHAVRH